jgi:hypothetical protein
LADAGPARAPAFPADLLRARQSVRRRWALTGRITGLAACVLIGIGLHAVWMGGAKPAFDGARSTASVQRTDVTRMEPRPVAVETQPPGFWSGRQWYERAEQNRSERNSRVIWDSPLGRPRLGDAT